MIKQPSASKRNHHVSTDLKPLGKIVRLQIQPSSLKVGEKPNRQYDPTPLLPVKQLTLTPLGAVARSAEGEPILDIHHTQHPATHNIDNINPFSVNFTSHYEMMKAEYGGHLWNGCAGENILIETLTRLTLDNLASGMAIKRQNGDRQNDDVIWLRETQVAHPCRPFSGYVMGGTEASVKEALQFLDNGMRGFYCQLAHDQPVTISIGDMVFIP
jgi:hypothetical protein